MNSLDILCVTLLASIASVAGQGCQTSYVEVNGKCYRQYNQEETYKNAKSICEGEGAWVAAVKDSQTQEYISSVMETRNWEQLWIGLTESYVSWRWVSDNSPLFHQGCVHTTSEMTQLSLLVGKSASTTLTTCVVQCVDASYSYAGVKLNGSEVECWCGNSFSPSSADVKRCHTKCPADDAAVCGNNDGAMWVVNLKAEFITNLWYRDQPNNYDNYQGCLSLHGESGYRWGDEDCHIASLPGSYDNHHICGYDRATSMCFGAGRRWVGGQCISVHNSTTVSWFEANMDCRGREGYLVKVGSEEFFTALVEDVLAGTGSRWWTGASNARWTWPDGSEVVYSYFARDRPDKPDENCVYVNKFTGSTLFQWEDASCDDLKNRFICEKAIPITSTTTTPTPTTTTTPTTTAPTTTTPTTTTPTTTTPTTTAPTTTTTTTTTSSTTTTTTPSSAATLTTTTTTTTTTPSSTTPSSAPPTTSSTRSSANGNGSNTPTSTIASRPSQSPQEGDDDSMTTGVIIGVAVPCVAVLVGFLRLLVYLCQRSRTTSGDKRGLTE